MIDKVQEIRKEVKRLKSNLIHGACSSQIAMEANCKEEAYNEVLAILDSLQEEPISEGQVKKSAETQHVNETCKEKVNSLTQEPVSEELEEAARKIATRHSHISGDTYYANDAWFFKKGAQWQKERFEMNSLAACDKQTEGEAKIEFDFAMGIIKKEHRQPTFDDAIKYGMKLHKDLGITWEDVKMLDDISDDVYAECNVEMFDEKEYYLEILKRFKNK